MTQFRSYESEIFSQVILKANVNKLDTLLCLFVYVFLNIQINYLYIYYPILYTHFIAICVLAKNTVTLLIKLYSYWKNWLYIWNREQVTWKYVANLYFLLWPSHLQYFATNFKLRKYLNSTWSWNQSLIEVIHKAILMANQTKISEVICDCKNCCI